MSKWEESFSKTMDQLKQDIINEVKKSKLTMYAQPRRSAADTIFTISYESQKKERPNERWEEYLVFGTVEQAGIHLQANGFKPAENGKFEKMVDEETILAFISEKKFQEK